MTEFNATEIAYKKGYEAGRAEIETLKVENERLKCLNKTWEQSLDIKEQLNEEYRKENAELKARLEKAVEFNDTPYYFITTNLMPTIIKSLPLIAFKRPAPLNWDTTKKDRFFKTKESAEAKLAELKGERK